MQQRCQADLQTLPITGAASHCDHFGAAADMLSNSLGSMAVSLEASRSSCSQLLADSADTLMADYEALEPTLLGSSPQRLVRGH